MGEEKEKKKKKQQHIQDCLRKAES